VRGRQAKAGRGAGDLVATAHAVFEFAIRSLPTEYDLDSVDGQVTELQRTVRSWPDQGTCQPGRYATKLTGG